MQKQRCRSAARLHSTADQRPGFCYIDITITLLSKSKVSNLKPSSVAVQPSDRFVLDLVGNPVDRFSRDMAKIIDGDDDMRITNIYSENVFLS